MNANRSLTSNCALTVARPGLIERLAPAVLTWAATRAPQGLRERLTEEWLADFLQHQGSLARLRFVAGCCWAATIIRHENPLIAPVAVALAGTQVAVSTPPIRRSPGRAVVASRRRPAADDTVMSEMNITPLIDVMLVLLVTLIISLPTMTHAVKLSLPGVAPLPASQPAVIDLDIDADGTLVWNGTVLTGLQQLDGYFRAEAQKDPQAEIHLRPERRARYDVVAKVLASAQRNRLEKMGFANTGEFAN
jgi:biopolymer transport protein ExbD